jgi:hypothetical protein
MTKFTITTVVLPLIPRHGNVVVAHVQVLRRNRPAKVLSLTGALYG